MGPAVTKWGAARPARRHAAALTLAAFLGGCGGASAEPPIEDAPTIPVRVVQPSMRRALPAIVLTGTLGAKEEIPLGFKVGGVVARVLADAGSHVREGDVLAELSLTEIEARVVGAREGRDKARRDLARARALHDDSVATRAQLEDAATQLEVAEAQLRAAEFDRQYAVVRAPAAGVVLRRQLEPGQLVGPGTPVFVLRSERRGLVLRAAAADRDAVRLKVGERAEVTFDAFPGERFAAGIERVGVAASPVTGTYEVELAMAPASRALVSGLIGRATLRPSGEHALPFIPAEALLEVDGAQASVFVVDGASRVAHRVSVRVVFLDGAMAAVVGPFTDSTLVVTAGATRLVEGARVTLP